MMGVVAEMKELSELRNSMSDMVGTGNVTIVKYTAGEYDKIKGRVMLYVSRLSHNNELKFNSYLRQFVRFRDTYKPFYEKSEYGSASDMFDEMVVIWMSTIHYKKYKPFLGLLADDVIGVHSNRLVLDLLAYAGKDSLQRYENGMKRIIQKAKLSKTVDMTQSFDRLMNFYNSKIKLEQIDKGSELQIRFGCNTCPMYYNNTCPYGLKGTNGSNNEQQEKKGGCNERYGFYISTAMMFNTDIPAVITDHLIELKNKARDMTIDDLKAGKTSREYVQIHSVMAMLESKLLDVHRRTKTPTELKASFNDIRQLLYKNNLLNESNPNTTEPDRNNNEGNEGNNGPEVQGLGLEQGQTGKPEDVTRPDSVRLCVPERQPEPALEVKTIPRPDN